MTKLLVFFLMTSLSFGAVLPKKSVHAPAPEKTSQVEGVKIRTAQEDAELKDWIVGIQKLAQDAQANADSAEKEAAESRANLDHATTSLKEATVRADTLQTAIDAQTKAMQDAIIEKNKAVAHDKKTTEQNNFLKNILGIEAALIAVFLCLWLKVPALSPPWGLVATAAAPILVFGLVKLIL